jgi:hypothetical protein
MFLAFSYVIVNKPKMKNWIYRHSTGFLNYTIVLTNRYIAGLSNVTHNSFQIINIYSSSGQSRVSEIPRH